MTAELVELTSPEAAFAEALTAFQAELPHVAKGQTAKVPTKAGGSYSYDYADLTDITAAAVPLLSKHGLSWTAAPTVTEHGFVLRYSLLHIAGHRESGEYPLPDPARSSPQEIGSALTYSRRYALCAVTGIAPGGDDDDGQKASSARSADPMRAPKRAERKGAEQLAAEPDPWTAAAPAAEPERVTDLAWIDGFRQRITAATTAGELRGLQGEANGKWAEHKLSREDAQALRGEVGQRMAELAVPA